MSDDEAMALGRRAVASKHWRWMGGMLDMQGRTWTPCILFRAHPTDVPDLRDPATMGCLVRLVREAWDDPHASSRWMKPEWKVLAQRPGYVVYTVVGVGRTEADAWVRALEAAPA